MRSEILYKSPGPVGFSMKGLSLCRNISDRVGDRTWRNIQRENLKSVGDLADFLELSAEQREELVARPPFSLNLPRRLAAKCAKGTLSDPLLLQFLPLKEELESAEGFSPAPVEDERFCKGPRLLSKYEGRVLLIVTGACAMHCRYCFRQNFPYQLSQVLDRELALIAADKSLSEVILSGGDPLSLSNAQLSSLLSKLGAASHLKRVRIHTRFPIGIPERIDSRFLQILEQCSQQVWFVVHINHPLELDEEVGRALKCVQRLGVPVLNQAVLLKGVNDQLETLKELHLELVDWGIQPYYLHQLDRVTGAQRFEVSPARGLQLVEALRHHLPGYAVPSYVREIPGQLSKTPLTSDRWE